MKTLNLKFITAKGSDESIRVANPKEELTPEEIKAAMTVLMDKNIFSYNGGDIIGLDGAEIIETTTTNIDM